MNKPPKADSMRMETLIEMKGVSLITAEGRPLFRNIHMILGPEKVAVIGRNGVGKTTFLHTILGKERPASGIVIRRTDPIEVPQQIRQAKDVLDRLSSLVSTDRPDLELELHLAGLPSLTHLQNSFALSDGERRKLQLLCAKLSRKDLLLLDEPTEDLDEAGRKWLFQWIRDWKMGLVVVSHDRDLLSLFRNFFIVAESGCRTFSGGFKELEEHMEQEAQEAEIRFLRGVNALVRKEEKNEKSIRRRRRKKNFGRISELERCTPRQRLNKKRSLAQVSQGRAQKVSQKRMDTARQLTYACRRSLAVQLPLELCIPDVDISEEAELVLLEGVSACFDGRFLFRDIRLSIGYEHVAVVGPNGVGKTTLLNMIVGELRPFCGKVTTNGRLGFISQGGENWMTEDSLSTLLLTRSSLQSFGEILPMLMKHKFPIALANPSLRSLSPGERFRAALICLYNQRPVPQVLVLDEPTHCLDFVGETALRESLKAWPGALIVASHNREFLKSIGVSRYLTLEMTGRHTVLSHADGHFGVEVKILGGNEKNGV